MKQQRDIREKLKEQNTITQQALCKTTELIFANQKWATSQLLEAKASFSWLIKNTAPPTQASQQKSY